MSAPDVRTRILQVATRLFGEKGYGSTSVRELVEAAGVTKPTLYYHFGSKEGLFLTAVKEHVGQLACLAELAESTQGPIAIRLRTFVESYVRGAMERPDAVRFLLTLKHAPNGNGDAERQPSVDLLSMHMHNAQRLEVLLDRGKATGELRPDLDSRVAVLALIGVVNMLAMTAFHGFPVPDSHIDQVVDLFLDGAAAR